MKHLTAVLLFLAVFMFTNYSLRSQSPQWLWTAQAGGIDASDEGIAVVTDDAGNILVTGDFYGPNAVFGDTALISAGSSDIFIAKYNSDGNLLWAEQAGGSSGDFGADIDTDISGNIVATGRFWHIATFGDTVLSSPGGGDIFIARYDGEGNLLWAERAGGTAGEEGTSVAVHDSGSALVTGWFGPVATFGDTTLTGNAFLDIFIAKYDKNGNLLWVEQAGGDYDDVGENIALDRLGRCLVTGSFSATASFGDTTLTAAGGRDIFIAKYDENGQLLWAERAGGTDVHGDVGRSIATDPSGNSLVTGWFWGTATFGDTTLTTTGDVSAFIAKYDENGHLLWAKRPGGTDTHVGEGIATDGSGNSLITGYFFGSAVFGDTTLNSAGGTDVFIAKYNGDGNPLWAERAGGTWEDFGESHLLPDLFLIPHHSGTPH